MMFSRDLPSPASIFSTYASMAGYVMMIKQIFHTIVPLRVQNLVINYIKSLVFRSRPPPSTLTLIISDKIGTERTGMMTRGQNELYTAAQTYLSSKISPDALRLRMSKDPNDKKVNLHMCQGEVVSDNYQGIELKWRYLAGGYNRNNNTPEDGGGGGQHFVGNIQWENLELSFEKKHKDFVLNSYVPYVEEKAKAIKNARRILKMHSYSSGMMPSRWESVNFEHPSTFDTLAMNDELKRSVIKDLDRFIRRKDFYKRVGKAWKRGYLLYGPPGTGKTSLVAAMANHLKFDIYDLQLASVHSDNQLRNLLLTTNNSSILLIEDIDCSVDMPTRSQSATTTTQKIGASKVSTFLTLSGILNCIDGLWSSCGDERIIVFTTNNKENLDSALLRPGRMDMHIYMGHCGFDGFKTLATNYLGISSENEHRLYPEIKHLIDGKVLTPAQVAEELMKDEDVDAALEGLVKVLKRKRFEMEKLCDDDDESNKKVKELEEGEKRISEDDETLRRQILTPTQAENEDVVIE